MDFRAKQEVESHSSALGYGKYLEAVVENKSHRRLSAGRVPWLGNTEELVTDCVGSIELEMLEGCADALLGRICRILMLVPCALH